MAEKKNDILWRVYLVFGGFLLFGLAIIFRVGHLQLAEGDYWKRKADSLTLRYQNIEPMRGNIYSADGSLLATSLPRYDVHLDMVSAGKNAQVFNDNVDSLAFCLSTLFGDKSKADYKRMLKEGRRDKERYFLLKRNISFNEQKAIRTFPLFRMGKNKGGLIITQLSRREKPFKMLASRTIGYRIDNSEVTPVGIEGAFDKSLRGSTGKRLMQKIAGNVWKPVNNDNEIEPMDGQDVVTTIDLNLQDVAENALLRQLKEHNADMGCAILMEVATGQIKAIANLKRVGEDDNYTEEFNYALGQGSEPGSTFKLVSLMAAIEDGYVDLNDSINTYGGVMNLAGGYKMNDSHKGLYGMLSVKKAFAVSSNVGISALIMKYYSKNPQAFVNRVKSMHISDPLGLQLAGEAQPRIKGTNDKDWSKLSLPFMSIGYESTLSPLQLLTFYNAVANNGKMVQPLFVKEIRNKGQLVKSFPTKVISDSICSARTIAKARLLLEEVVKNGTASAIKHAQYTIAGKTGTAQIAQGAGGYKTGKIKYQASFCGYFPADKPQYSCIVVVYAPGTDVYYGASVACPVFKEISDKVFALNVQMHEELKTVPDSMFAGLPKVKAGRSTPSNLAVRNLDLAVELPQNGWHTVSRDPFTPSDDKVPNVVGMGLRDALYLLESQGMEVSPVGRGTVIKQSISSGTKLVRGQRIIIELG
ncbi:penicillin-binding protein [soil metagenome]